MGYTHYWKTGKRPTNDQWDSIHAAVKMLYATKEVKPLIQYESDDTTPPFVDDEYIRFNGRGDEGHETFLFSRDVTGFEFCKTAEKPYDIAVVACLCIAKHFAPDCFSVSSDGYQDEWEDGRQLAMDVIGVPILMGDEIQPCPTVPG